MTEEPPFKQGDYVVGCGEWAESDPFWWPKKAHPTRVSGYDPETGRVMLCSGLTVKPEALMLYSVYKATLALAESSGPPDADYQHAVDAMSYAMQTTRSTLVNSILTGRKRK